MEQGKKRVRQKALRRWIEAELYAISISRFFWGGL